MRHLLLFLTAVLFFAPAARAAAPSTVWRVATYATGGASILPAAGQAATDARGDLFVLATETATGRACMVLIKYQGASGVVAWRREACGDANSAAVALGIDGSGNAIVAGNVSGTFRLIKYANGGATLWDQRFAGHGLEVAFGMAPAGDDVYLMGRSVAPSGEIWIAKHRGGDGSMAWQQPVDAGAEVAPVGIASDRSGNAFVVGNYRNSLGGDDWHLAKLAGSSGAVLWRRIYDGSPRNVAAALTVDAAGDAVVTGISSGIGTAAIRTVKCAGATGRTIWEASDAAAGNASAASLRHDAAGNIVVTGSSGDDIRTLKYAASSGALLWQHRHEGGGMGSEIGRAITFDARGNVAVTGRSYAPHVTGAELRTIKYGADGAVLWSAGEAGGGRDDSGEALATAGSTVYAVGRSTDAAGNAGLRIVKYGEPDAALPPTAMSVQGLWWQPSQSGWGVNLTHQGDIVFATWFTYDAHGQPLWLVMSHGARVAANAYEGTLYRTSGPAFSSSPFDPSKVAATAVGSARFTFSDASNGTFSYTVDGVSSARAITRQVFAQPAVTCALGGPAGAMPNYQDLWWAPDGAESGWGVNITHQGDVLFVTWFTYGPDGRGIWLVGSNVAKTGNATYAGTLYRTVGPPYSAEPWNPSLVAVAAAGHASFVFSDHDNGTFTYTLDGVSQSKRITRQAYSSPRTVCR